MSKRKLAGLICIFAAVVLIVLAFALPIYKTAPRVQDYNGKDVIMNEIGFGFGMEPPGADGGMGGCSRL